MSIVSKWIKFLGGFDPITIAYVGGMTTKPSYAFQKVIDELVKDSETVNGTAYKFKTLITSKADVMYLGNINNSNDSFRNLVKNAHHGAIQGIGLVFDSYWGWTNPAGTGHVKTNYAPSTQGVRYTVNNAGVAIGITGTNEAAAQMPIACYDGVNITAFTISTYYYINSSSSLSRATYPFNVGLQYIRRTANNAASYINQNISNASSTITSTSVPGGEFVLFRRVAGSTSFAYLGGLNFTYIGASLTNDEFTAMNIMVNRYLKKCLYLKYGADNWGVKMAKSYFDTLHNFEPYEAWEIYEFIKRMQSDYVDGAGTGYYYNTFGPAGQNKTIADFIMLFKAGGNLLSNGWSKTGATLRWNQDGTITSSNTMPAYTRGTNLGIVTVSSTDGWNGVSQIAMVNTGSSVNSLYGNFPNFLRVLKTSGTVRFSTRRNRFKHDLRGTQIAGMLYGIYEDTITFPGYFKMNISDLIGGNYSSTFFVQGELYNANSKISGDFSTITNEFLTSSLLIQSDKSVIGSLRNMLMRDILESIQFQNTGITRGTTGWNKNILALHLSDCLLNTAAVDEQLAEGDNYYVGGVTPIKVQTVNLSGASMGIPTGAGNNVNLLSWVAKGSAVGYPPVITVRTS